MSYHLLSAYCVPSLCEFLMGIISVDSPGTQAYHVSISTPTLQTRKQHSLRWKMLGQRILICRSFDTDLAPERHLISRCQNQRQSCNNGRLTGRSASNQERLPRAAWEAEGTS